MKRIKELWTPGVRDAVIAGIVLAVVIPWGTHLLGFSSDVWEWISAPGAVVRGALIVTALGIIVGAYCAIKMLRRRPPSTFDKAEVRARGRANARARAAESNEAYMRTLPQPRVTEAAEAESAPSVVHPGFASKSPRIKVLEGLQKTQGKAGGAGATLVAAMAAMERDVVAEELRRLYAEDLARVVEHEADEVTFAITSKGADYLRNALLAM